MKPGKCLRIFLTESDRINGKPAMEAVLELCHSAGLQGVSVTRGIEGMGMHGVHSASFLSLATDLPLLVEAIDSPEKIDQAIDIMRPHLGNRLLAVWPVEIMRSGDTDSCN